MAPFAHKHSRARACGKRQTVTAIPYGLAQPMPGVVGGEM